MSLNRSRLKWIVKWMLITDIVAVVVGVALHMLGWRDEFVRATNTLAIPQPSPIETVLLFVGTVALFYVLAELAEDEFGTVSE